MVPYEIRMAGGENGNPVNNFQRKKKITTHKLVVEKQSTTNG